MTIETLKQYRSLKAEIVELSIRKEQYYVCDVVKSSQKEHPFIQGRVKVEGYSNTVEVIKLKVAIITLMKKCDIIEKFVDNIDDSFTRRVFLLRYVAKKEGVMPMSWQRVATRMGISDESYPRRIHNRYMSRLDK